MARRCVERTSPKSRSSLASSLSDDELDMFTEQLGQILEHANDIAALELDDVVRDGSSLRTDQRGARRSARSQSSASTKYSPWRPTRRTVVSRCRESWERPREERPEIASDVHGRRNVGAAEALALAGRDSRAQRGTERLCSRRRGRARASVAQRVDERVARGEDPGALAGVPIALKDNLCQHRGPHDGGIADPRRVAPALQRHGRRTAAGGGRGAGGQDQHGRVRHGFVDRELVLRADAQPARPRRACPAARRAVRRRRSRPT